MTLSSRLLADPIDRHLRELLVAALHFGGGEGEPDHRLLILLLAGGAYTHFAERASVKDEGRPSLAAGLSLYFFTSRDK